MAIHLWCKSALFCLLAVMGSLLILGGCSGLGPSEPSDSTPTPSTFTLGVDSDDELDAQLLDLLVSSSHGEGILFFQLPKSNELHRIPQDPNNPLTLDRILLGKLLYHETALGANNVRPEGYETYSCASCHFAEAGFMANLPQGISEGGRGFGIAGEARTLLPQYDCLPAIPDCQPIRTPTVLNGAYQQLMLWNGQFGGVGDNLGTEDKWTPGTPLESNYLGLHGLETQAHGGLLAHRMVDVEMSGITTIPRYRLMYKLAFPGDGEAINRLNTALAIAAYERSVLANEAPFQKWLYGNKTSMTVEQKRGAILFFGSAGCVACHTGPALNSMTFHALGMQDLDGSYDSRINLVPFGGTIPENVRKGRGGFTGRLEDEYKFKTPQLYNLTDSPFYGHGSSFSTVREVVEYMNAAIPENPIVPAGQLAFEFRPLSLTTDEVNDLVTFVEEALYDSRLIRFVPRRLPSGNCFPVNDPQSQIDLDCKPITAKASLKKG